MTFTKGFYTLMASLLVAENSFAAGATTVTDSKGFFGQDRASSLNPGAGSGENAIIGFIQNVLGFVTIIAVGYVLWAGFQLVTAGGDEEKMKKSKTTIIQVVIGIVVMWLAYSIVTWVMNSLTK
ncbi:hypothetical protein KBB25_01855 [Candidatus Gracilibacteria bacterium]|nr:hypothetical protein [Candidatus Gracilibacteria bacterium]